MSKRRDRGAPALPEPEEPTRPMGTLTAVGVGAALLVLAVLGGVLLRFGATPPTVAGLAGCRPAAETAPLAYAARPSRCVDPARHYAAILHTTKGDVTISLDAASAPDTVSNFAVLANGGFYNGQVFFRSLDWVVQGGDPAGDGTGGPGYTLPEELAPTASWAPGSVGMARNAAGTINGSQFFITRTAWPGGSPTAVYNRFGTVTLGFDVVTQLGSGDRILRVDVRAA